MSENDDRLQKLLEMLIEKSRKEWKYQPSASAINFQFFWEQRCREFNRRQKCNHRKGSQWGGLIDYAVSFHTFIDGSQRIACLKGCGFEVYNKPEWSFKWAVGLKMVEQSTNTRTSSEVVIPCPPFTRQRMDFGDFKIADTTIDIGDANPIKGMQQATPMPDEDANAAIIL